MLPYFAGVLETFIAPPVQVVLAGDPHGEGTRRFIRLMSSCFSPSRVVYYADGGSGQAELSVLVPALSGMGTIGGKSAGYICHDFVCALPTTNPEEFASQLAKV